MDDLEKANKWMINNLPELRRMKAVLDNEFCLRCHKKLSECIHAYTTINQ